MSRLARRASQLGFSAALFLGAVGCSKIGNYAFDASLSDLAGQDGGGGTPSPSPSGEPVVVCDPNDSANMQDGSLGLKGRLYVDPNRQIARSELFPTQGTDLGVDLFLSRVNVPTRAFNQGFKTEDGTILKDGSGEVLIEYFGMDVKSKLRLSDSDSEGEYQLAVVSDDGSSLFLNGALLIDNEGAHPPKMGCASQSVSLSKASRIPLRLTYFQGPRHHIAMVLMWRKAPADQAMDPLCGKIFNTWSFEQDGSPVGDYKELLSRGWRPLEAGNFELQEGVNRCVK